MKVIEPSLLSINHKDYLNQLKQIKQLGLDYVHYDVMEKAFCNNEAFTDQYLSDIDAVGLKANVHLMVCEPMKWLHYYGNHNINAITFHAETQGIEEAKEIIDAIHKLGFKAGIAIKFTTDLNKFEALAQYCDIITIMSVEPGKGGQKFNPICSHNLTIANKWKHINNNLIIEIDGGINDQYIKGLNNQVDYFVTGSWFFNNIDNMESYLTMLRK